MANARREISTRGRPEEELEQRLLLQDEGVVFDARDRVVLARYQWDVAREFR